MFPKTVVNWNALMFTPLPGMTVSVIPKPLPKSMKFITVPTGGTSSGVEPTLPEVTLVIRIALLWVFVAASHCR